MFTKEQQAAHLRASSLALSRSASIRSNSRFAWLACSVAHNKCRYAGDLLLHGRSGASITSARCRSNSICQEALACLCAAAACAASRLALAKSASICLLADSLAS